MRTFITLLILTNLAYFGWNLSRPQESRQTMVREPSVQASRTLQLLSETQVENTSAAVEPAICISLGVFNNTEESDFLVSALLERGLEASPELLPSAENMNYRVYMPPFNSDIAERQTLEELRSSNIDSFIITTGEQAGGISLGVFSLENLALGHQENLAGQGFATSIQEIATSSNEIWVTIQGLSQALLEGSDLLDLLSEGLELEVIEKPCETFASRP
jgi:hypothetical protein